MKIRKTSLIPTGIIVALVLVVAIIALFGFLPHARAEGPAGSRLVTIYDRGQELSVITTKDTLREVFQEIGLVFDNNDIVEPGVDEQLVSNDYHVNIYRARPVVIQDGAQQVKVMSAYQTPKQIAEHAGVELRNEDEATLDLTDNIMADGASERLVIDRANPVKLVLYSKEETIYTQAETVADLIKEKGIKLASNDEVSLPGKTSVTPNIKVEIWRNGKQTVTVEEDVDFPVEQIRDINQAFGYKEIRSPGVKGKRNVTYEIEMKSGQIVDRKEIQNVVTRQPEKQIEVIGVKVASPSENEAVTWSFLLNQGFTREQAAGIMGNLMQEHGFRTDGDGLAQWTGGRKARLMAMEDPYSVQTQLEFMMSELNGGYSKAKNAIVASTTVEGAVKAFQNLYERCGVCAESRRVDYAYSILGRY